MSNSDNNKKQQRKITVSFRDNPEEDILYNWVLEQSKVIGMANAIKQILYKSMNEEKGK